MKINEFKQLREALKPHFQHLHLSEVLNSREYRDRYFFRFIRPGCPSDCYLVYMDIHDSLYLQVRNRMISEPFTFWSVDEASEEILIRISGSRIGVRSISLEEEFFGRVHGS